MHRVTSEQFQAGGYFLLPKGRRYTLVCSDPHLGVKIWDEEQRTRFNNPEGGWRISSTPFAHDWGDDELMNLIPFNIENVYNLLFGHSPPPHCIPNQGGGGKRKRRKSKQKRKKSKQKRK